MRTNVRALSALIAGGVLVAGTATSYADNVTNNLDNSVDATYERVALNAGGATQEVKLHIVAVDGDGRQNCNVNGSNKLTISLTSSNTTVATISPISQEFSGCGSDHAKTFTVTPHAEGTADFTASGPPTSRSGSMNYAPANFTVNVSTPAPANTAPTVTISGVIAGASYNKGSVPTAICDVVDAEDGNSSYAATLSSITGDNAADGIGNRTASCDYTDKGGLRETASATFSIIDPSAPTIGKTLNPTAPDGDNGWYKSNVSLGWTVSESESPNSLQKTGCVDQNITADQAATTYSCSATSAGGSAEEQSVVIKRDGTAPSVSYTSAAGTTGNNGWYTSPVTATFTGTDATSGPATATQTATSSGDGAAVAVSSPAFSDVAGNTRAAGAASESFKIDTVAPTVSYTSASGTTGTNGWYTSPVTATFTGTDATSGPATATQTATSSGDGAAVAVSSPAFSDVAGNTRAAGAASESFQIDTVAPSVSANQSNTTWSNAASVTSGFFTASDATSGIADADKSFTLTASAESTKNENGVVPTTVTRDVTDAAGHTTTRSFTALIDRGAPTVSLVGGPANGATLYTTQATSPTCSASDDLSGLSGDCVVSGYSAAAGTHTVTATVTDRAGNTSTTSRTYTLRDMTHTGFYSPVEMAAGVANTVKGGGTVPLKFNVLIDGVQQDSTALVSSFAATKVSCTTGTLEDAVDFVTTGSTALRWDATAMQFIQNWKTPTDAGSCYKATATLADGDTITAQFKLK
jgi:hypothetical protein